MMDISERTNTTERHSADDENSTDQESRIGVMKIIVLHCWKNQFVSTRLVNE